ncbi:SDR family NAD(P)-dependent oxidoreductase [Streptomyces sp. SID1121]|uniref:SDR family NAD(P)-dependent oxidoreductase n=1 Tax=Streptomyces sp. SID1121 TaxID=3425888 RepID=UPI004055E1D7
MTTTLITGSNKGLGYETARQLIGAGHDVWIGARDPERGAAAAHTLGARFVQLDVTDEASVSAAVATVGELDVLVNNAGILGGTEAVGDVTAEAVRHVYETNVFGVVRVTHAFLPLLEKSAAPVVVNLGSALGSLALNSDPDTLASSFAVLAYQSSKTALNMITVQYAKAYPGMRINCVDPGYTATDFNGGGGDKTVGEGAEIVVRMASAGGDGPTGGFFNSAGPQPW